MSTELIHASAPVLWPLGVHPVLGRDFIKQDSDKPPPRVAIISTDVWKFPGGSRRVIIGQKIGAGGQKFAGVAAAAKSPAVLEDRKVWVADP